MVRARATPRMTATLGNVEFRALWAAEAQSIAGDQLAKVALAILVYDRTGSAMWAAGVYALTFLPALMGGLGLAQLADRYPRRGLIVCCTAAQAVLVGLMAVPGAPLILLCVLVVAVQLVQAPANAAQNALTREVFTDDDAYLRSQDLRGITTNAVMLLGLAGGGLLVALIGTSWALALNALTFLVSSLVVHRWVRARPVAGDTREPWFGAIRWVFAQPGLRALMALSWLVGLAVVPEGLAAPIAHQIGAPDHAVGWLLAADPLGFVAGAYLLSRFGTAESRRRLVGVLAVASLAILVGFATEPGLLAALLLLALAGAAGAYIITVSATFSTWVPNHMRGSAGGVYRTGLRVAQGVGVALGGVLAERLGSAVDAVAVTGVFGVLVAIPVAIAWSGARRARSGPQPTYAE